MQLFTYSPTSTFVAAGGKRGATQREGMTSNGRDGERIGRRRMVKEQERGGGDSGEGV